MSEQKPVQLEPVDALDVTIVVDNVIDDLAASTELAKRQPLARDYFEREHLRAEHGYSLWVTVARAGRRDTPLYDAGLSPGTAAHNLGVLDYDLKDVRTVVFSHGHADHHTGLAGITQALGRRGLPLGAAPGPWRTAALSSPTAPRCTCHHSVGRISTGKGGRLWRSADRH